MKHILSLSNFTNRFQGFQQLEILSDTNCSSNSNIYALTEKLTQATTPSRVKKDDITWENLYAPLKTKKGSVLFPFSVSQERDGFFIFLGKHGRIAISRGMGNDPTIQKLLESVLRFNNSNFNNVYFIEACALLFSFREDTW